MIPGILLPFFYIMEKTLCKSCLQLASGGTLIIFDTKDIACRNCYTGKKVQAKFPL